MEHNHDHNCNHEHGCDHNCNHEHEHVTTVTLEDENGEKQEFEIVDTFEVDDNMYAALVPFNNIKASEEVLEDDIAELLLLKFIYEGEEELLEIIEDDAEYEKVLNSLMENLPDGYDVEE